MTRYDHPHIMAGQGTLGLEILEDLPDVNAVLVPVGGGGLIAGVATAIKHLQPNVKIYVRIIFYGFKVMGKVAYNFYTIHLSI